MAFNNPSNSQNTNSTTLVKDPINISFNDVCYKVRKSFFCRAHKIILDNISGQFAAGELSVIVGESGAGKSSLMDILAGYTKPTSGTISVNGQVRDIQLFKRRSCYILQDDKVHNALTVQESLKIAAELKLGNHVSQKQKLKRVEEIIQTLTICETRGTKAGSLSGGEKKRLAIGLELISDPSVMFLDEPTSGLDCLKSEQLIRHLQLLARQNRTVVISMHQPSARLLEMVDRLYAVAGGKCAYMGSVPLLLPYLEQLTMNCPQYHNTVDFLLEKCVEKDEEENELINKKDKMENGLINKKDKMENELINQKDKTENKPINKLVKCSGNGKSERWIQNIPIKTDTEYKRKEDTTAVKKLLALNSTYPTSLLKQVTVLTRREFLLIWRSPWRLLMLIGIHAGMAVFVGLLFYDIGENAEYVRDNLNFLFFSLMFLMFTAFSAVTSNFPEQIPVTRREHFNRWYNTCAYYASTLLSVLPMQTACTLVFFAVTYWLTGQPVESNRIFMYFGTLLLNSYVSMCAGFLNGSLFSVKNGVIFGPFFIMPFTILSGFFLHYKDAKNWMQWIYELSFLKHGLFGLLFSIYGMKRDKIPCSSLFCYYRPPKTLLDDMGMSQDFMFIFAVRGLGLTLLVFILCTYFILKIRLKSKW